MSIRRSGWGQLRRRDCNHVHTKRDEWQHIVSLQPAIAGMALSVTKWGEGTMSNKDVLRVNRIAAFLSTEALRKWDEGADASAASYPDGPMAYVASEASHLDLVRGFLRLAQFDGLRWSNCRERL